MRKLTEVEQAKELMAEAVEWSVMKWLREKKRVRRVADKANDALDALEKEVKGSWSSEMRVAYDELCTTGGAANQNGNSEAARQAARQIKRADDKACRAHMDAENTFDEAERQLSTRLAREGCSRAIASWELHEAAIRKAEGAMKS